VLDARLREPHDRLDGGGCELRIDDDWQGGVVTTKVFERVDLDGAGHRRISNDDVSGLVVDRGLELRPTRDGSE
jgi:hypothetical protein